MMKNVFLFFLAIMLVASCNNQPQENKEQTNAPVIGKHDLKLESEIMTPEVLWSFGRVSGVEVSPDGNKLLYGVSYYSAPENKGNRELFIMNADGSDVKQLTKTAGGEYNSVWKPDGSKIAYMCTQSGSMQMWEMNPDGSNPVQISDIEGGITAFKYSPDMTKVLYSKEVKLDETVRDKYPDLDKADANIATDLMYRHWDEWVKTYSHVFAADYDGKSLTNSVDILEGEKWDAPLKPFGGMEQVNWSPDSKNIAYTSRKKRGKEYAFSTNSDIYIYNLESKENDQSFRKA
ncbi:MAG: hypothetical protein HC831_00750 [Chloroflexia bacterium]|nr:hypothetical protein [Chloroflexia bacterium]